jgi:hypothetical protein
MRFEPKLPQGAIVTAIPIEAPRFHVSGFQLSCTSNDAVLLANQLRPSKLQNGDLAPFMPQETVAVLAMSIGSFKDLALLLADQVSEYERRTGRVIETDFMKTIKDSHNGR